MKFVSKKTHQRFNNIVLTLNIFHLIKAIQIRYQKLISYLKRYRGLSGYTKSKIYLFFNRILIAFDFILFNIESNLIRA